MNRGINQEPAHPPAGSVLERVRWVSTALVFLLVSLGLTSTATAGKDLAKHYPATMKWSQWGLRWTTSTEDVWALKSFEFELVSGLKISCEKSTVVFGVHETNVLWAVVFPEKPTRIRSTHAGNGERVKAICLRFSPAEINAVFPPRTVVGRGPARRRAEAGRIFRRKLGWKWFTSGGAPTIVSPGWFLVDIDTVEGPRRFYGVDRNSGTVEYVAEFERKAVPPPRPIKAREATEVFNAVWEAFDREYAMFGLLPDVNWEELKKRYGKNAAAARSTLVLASVIADMLAHLQDLHIWVKADSDWLPGYTRARPLNANLAACRKAIGRTEVSGRNLIWGQTEDGIGYLNVTGLNDASLPDRADAALKELAGTWALIVDLRFNGGGSESLARKVAERFNDRDRVYSKSRYRNGPKHDQLGRARARTFGSRPWRYESPVLVLWGRKTMSSAESLALMLAQCPQVTTLGDSTAGSSGNPRRLTFDCGIVVNMPRWIDLDPEGNPIERVGVAPDVRLSFERSAFTDANDPLLATALKRLRATPAKERKPGRRD